MTNMFIVLALTASALTLSAQSDQDKRVESMLQRMTLAQKIDLLGGVDMMYLRAVPEIGLPALKMSDGPMGVRSSPRCGSSTKMVRSRFP